MFISSIQKNTENLHFYCEKGRSDALRYEIGE